MLDYDIDTEFTLEDNVYEYLGYTLQSLLKICQSAFYAKDENMHYHRDQDIANVLNLVCNLIPMKEFELLDEILKKRMKYKKQSFIPCNLFQEFIGILYLFHEMSWKS